MASFPRVVVFNLVGKTSHPLPYWSMFCSSNPGCNAAKMLQISASGRVDRRGRPCIGADAFRDTAAPDRVAGFAQLRHAAPGQIDAVQAFQTGVAHHFGPLEAALLPAAPYAATATTPVSLFLRSKTLESRRARR
jgi:hypothetical protein